MSDSPIVITGEHMIYHFRPDMEPKWFVESGDLIEVQPPGGVGSWSPSEEDVVEQVDIENAEDSHNAATGPIHVQGALPGDTLMFDIMDIDVAVPVGRIMLIPTFGLLRNHFGQARTKIVNVDGETVDFNGLRIPVQPMIGTIGVAPATGAWSTVYPHDGGGNMDCNAVAPGSRIYLPVAVEGGLLAMGDTKPAMGDGEVNGTGVSAPVVIRGRVNVVKETIPRPIIETTDEWMTVASADTLEEACEFANLDMVRLLERNTGMSLEDAYMLTGVVGDLRICQVVNPKVTVRMAISKRYLPNAFRDSSLSTDA
jgi:amidase